MKKILITGCAGFIGFHLSKKLSKDYSILGIDSFEKNKFSKISQDRVKELKKIKNFKFKKISISNYKILKKIYEKNNFFAVINLAATAGVRASFNNPDLYFKNNILGFYNIYTLSIKQNVELFMFGSSSSVYGNNKDLKTDNPISFYAATKKCNEIISHSFLQSSSTKIVGLRFFTVYGPWGRPDMAVYKFSRNINLNKTIEVYNHGHHSRDFSYIDDIVQSIFLIIEKIKKLKNYQLFDIGKGKTNSLKNLLSLIEKNFNKKFKIKKTSLQKGDVMTTKADIKKLKNLTNFVPKTTLKSGIENFVKWYKTYYK
ncbi:NAD-dependent epimerase/dehydratase family protein [Candidatus Pelagibacter sp.]|uniref:NAD-dependent epimerase/dehydratase family protein n=1 Tax=Candidatus Pelagibacter sp. TaxID=2024849 RepID=UPI003F84CC3C